MYEMKIPLQDFVLKMQGGGGGGGAYLRDTAVNMIFNGNVSLEKLHGHACKIAKK